MRVGILVLVLCGGARRTRPRGTSRRTAVLECIRSYWSLLSGAACVVWGGQRTSSLEAQSGAHMISASRSADATSHIGPPMAEGRGLVARGVSAAPVASFVMGV